MFGESVGWWQVEKKKEILVAGHSDGFAVYLDDDTLFMRQAGEHMFGTDDTPEAREDLTTACNLLNKYDPDVPKD